jgi:Protein of unknown function, DUF481
MTLRRALLAGGLSLLALAASAFAQKTDVVVLLNGDRITGEIKSYASGRLTVDTYGAGDANVKWNRIQSITAARTYEVQTTDGLYHYGSLAPSDPVGRLDVVSAEKRESFDFLSVVRLAPLYQRFWNRLNGSLDLGLTYTQANNYVQFTLNANATVHKPAFATSVTLSTFFASQQGVTSTQRASFGAVYEKFLKNHWALLGGFGLDRNLDLGLDLRASLTAAIGRDLVQTNQTTLTAFAGLSGSRETPVEGDTTHNLAGVLGVRYSTFTYDFPKLTVSTSMAIVPYITDSGRVRLEFQAQAKREIIRDFYLSLSLFDSFDSRDPTTQQSKNDWGPVLSVGWTF